MLSSNTETNRTGVLAEVDIAVRTAAVYWLDYSPPTLANRVQFPAGSLPDFRMRQSCRMMPLVGGFSRRSPISLTLAFRCCSTHLTSPSSALKTSISAHFTVKPPIAYSAAVHTMQVGVVYMKVLTFLYRKDALYLYDQKGCAGVVALPHDCSPCLRFRLHVGHGVGVAAASKLSYNHTPTTRAQSNTINLLLIAAGRSAGEETHRKPACQRFQDGRVHTSTGVSTSPAYLTQSRAIYRREEMGQGARPRCAVDTSCVDQAGVRAPNVPLVLHQRNASEVESPTFFPPTIWFCAAHRLPTSRPEPRSLVTALVDCRLLFPHRPQRRPRRIVERKKVRQLSYAYEKFVHYRAVGCVLKSHHRKPIIYERRCDPQQSAYPRRIFLEHWTTMYRCAQNGQVPSSCNMPTTVDAECR
ncbi:hypothetical protein PR048_026515 [Dryococelus australis]|uniref:Uncharacterized protein n=1 Tax=Dryococelus australis TaxID=614101 RepID=A0ABQ9GLI7_9NEOP|nr:hypothetical protein PR048_026515 [Dryococelus australis]